MTWFVIAVIVYFTIGVVVALVMNYFDENFLKRDTPDATHPALFATAVMFLWWLCVYYAWKEMKRAGGEANDG